MDFGWMMMYSSGGKLRRRRSIPLHKCIRPSTDSAHKLFFQGNLTHHGYHAI
jgi:hypothetical protein